MTKRKPTVADREAFARKEHEREVARIKKRMDAELVEIMGMILGDPETAVTLKEGEKR